MEENSENYPEQKIVVNADVFNSFEQEKFSTAKRDRSNSLTLEENRSEDTTETSVIAESQRGKMLINRRKTVDSSGRPFQRGITKKDLRVTHKMTAKFRESRDIIFAEKRRYVHKINKVKLKDEAPIPTKKTREGASPKIIAIDNKSDTKIDKNVVFNDSKDKINKVFTDKRELPSPTKQLKVVKNNIKPSNKLYYVKNAAGKKVPLLLKTKTVLLKTTPELTKILVKNDNNISTSNYCKIADKVRPSCSSENSASSEQPAASTDTCDLIKTVKILQNGPGRNTEVMTLNYVQKKPTVNLKQPYVMKKMYFVADAVTQTISKPATISKDVGIQTDYIDIPETSENTGYPVLSTLVTDFDEGLPNIEELVTYLLEKEKDSEEINSCKKNQLMDISKVIQNKIHNEFRHEKSKLKRLLFIDLKECAVPNFLGNLRVHTAVLDGDLGVLRRQCFALKVRKISVDISNNQGQTALQLAILEDRSQSIVATLLSHGANVNILDDNGNNLFHLTVLYSSTESLEQLTQYYTNLPRGMNAKNDEGMTPLMLACMDSKLDLIECLLEHGADANIRDDKSGRTALFHAIELDLADVIHILLRYKANPKIRNFLGQSSIDVARDLNSNVEFFENTILNSVVINYKKNDADVSPSNSSASSSISPDIAKPRITSKKKPAKNLKTVPLVVKMPRKTSENSSDIKTSPKKRKRIEKE